MIASCRLCWTMNGPEFEVSQIFKWDVTNHLRIVAWKEGRGTETETETERERGRASKQELPLNETGNYVPT